MGSVISEQFRSILIHFNLNDEDCRTPVTSSHLDEISLRMCGDWRFLPSHLGLEDNVVEDINRKPTCTDEKGKRRELFRKWEQSKGSKATYERLIFALLKQEQRKDAERVCELLRDSLSTATPAQPSNKQATASSDNTPLQGIYISLL